MLSEAENLKLVTEATKDHQKVIQILRARTETLDSLLKHWQRKDLPNTLSTLISIKDPALFADALSCTFAEHPHPAMDMMILEQAEGLLKRCQDVLMTDKYRVHLTSATHTVKHIFDAFKAEIISSLNRVDSPSKK